MEFNCLKAAEPLKGNSLLFTIQSLELLVLIWSTSAGWKTNTPSHISIKPLGLYPSPEILSSFLLKLQMSPWLEKILKLMVFRIRLPENAFLTKKKKEFFTHLPQELLLMHSATKLLRAESSIHWNILSSKNRTRKFVKIHKILNHNKSSWKELKHFGLEILVVY